MNAPNQTLYVSNIDWKIKKPVLKRALHTLFNRHGKILDIIALRSEGLRGQAFILFDNVQAATAALQAEQGFTFFGKDLRVEYAREKSDRIAKRDGTFIPKDRRDKHQNKKRLKEDDANEIGGVDGENKDKKLKITHDDSSSRAMTNPAHGMKEESAKGDINPSNILFAESLPQDCNEMMLACLFRSYAGYKEVRIPRAGLAFVEFDDEPHATVALKALNGFKLSADDTLNLKYGKS